jgi:hypothetical protein
MSKVVKLQTQAAALKNCALMGTRGAAQDKLVQSVANTCVGYSVLHGDITIAQKAVELFPKGAKLASFVAFLEFHGNLKWDKDAGTVVHIKDADRGEATTKDLATLMGECDAKQWHEYGPKSTPKSQFDILDEVEALIKRMQSKVKKEEVEVAHVEALQGLVEFAAAQRAALV